MLGDMGRQTARASMVVCKIGKIFGLSICPITAAPIENREIFDHVVPYTPDHFDARGRVAAFQELTPFDVTLHLDTDT